MHAASTSTPDGVLRHDELVAHARDRSWDGKVLPYVPSEQRLRDRSAELHGEFDAELDPIEHQILRWRLWNVNLEHDETIRRVCGTSVVCHSLDYNTSMMTETGETVLGGPGLQRFVGQGDMAVKYVLEHRWDNPGVGPGDIFILNDPFIAGLHQNDVNACMPVFAGDRLFAWVFNAAHTMEIGGTHPGSFCSTARDIFDEPLPWPPVKLVRGGEVQHDVLEAFMRQSRMPAGIALNLRSQIAGLEAAAGRVERLVAEYGATRVKGVMRRMIRDTSRVVGERLLAIPDGEWQETFFSASSSDRRLRRLQLTARKTGDVVTFSNVGTSPQVANGNGTYCSFRAGAIACMQTLLAWDQMSCPAGVLDHLRFDPTPSTFSVASYPAAVTTLHGSQLNILLAGQVVSNMLLCGPDELRARAIATPGGGSSGFLVPWAIDDRGRLRFGAGSEALIGALGASPGLDGVDTGGIWEAPRLRAANVEEAERQAPVLHLYRREQVDSGGPGQWRGGNGVTAAFVGHKVRELHVAAMGNDPGVNNAIGLAGGRPGHSGSWFAATGVDMRERLAAGELPGTREEVERLVGALGALSPFDAVPTEIGDHGVVVAEFAAAGGFGDPLTRDPAQVEEDLATGAVSPEAVARDYGVVVGADGAVDATATGARRAHLRSERLRAAQPPSATVPANEAVHDRSPWLVAAGLGIVGRGPDAHWCCSECGGVLADASANFREGCARRERAPHEVDPLRYPEPTVAGDDGGELVIRELLCPLCGHLVVTDVASSTDDLAWDVMIDIDSLARLDSARAR